MRVPQGLVRTSLPSFFKRVPNLGGGGTGCGTGVALLLPCSKLLTTSWGTGRMWESGWRTKPEVSEEAGACDEPGALGVASRARNGVLGEQAGTGGFGAPSLHLPVLHPHPDFLAGSPVPAPQTSPPSTAHAGGERRPEQRWVWAKHVTTLGQQESVLGLLLWRQKRTPHPHPGSCEDDPSATTLGAWE